MPDADHPSRAPGSAGATPDAVAGPGAVDRTPDPTLQPDGHSALDQLFDVESLYALRSAVAAHGADLGLTEQTLSDLVLIAHELATNAIRHGGVTAASPGRLRLWATDGAVVCQVHDVGPGLADAAGAGTA